MNIKPDRAFGKITIPSDVNLSAFYEASDNIRISQNWEITPYLLRSENDDPIDMPTENLSSDLMHI